MEAHPGITFRSGPAGRRPGLVGGPDVWEVARLVRDVKQGGDDVVSQTVELSGLTPEQVRTAVRYYAEYRSEIDTWLACVDEEADRLEAAWRREQELLKR
ncbi:MAG TPA: hypothetical protein VK821_12720 [Dehalococcoidia bacterium]|nr:hypothetical protein [Dehalococcoidia bacterium]